MEVYNFDQDDLMTEDIHILDNHSEIYVWIGQQVDSKSRLHALTIGEVRITYFLANFTCYFSPMFRYIIWLFNWEEIFRHSVCPFLFPTNVIPKFLIYQCHRFYVIFISWESDTKSFPGCSFIIVFLKNYDILIIGNFLSYCNRNF